MRVVASGGCRSVVVVGYVVGDDIVGYNDGDGVLGLCVGCSALAVPLTLGSAEGAEDGDLALATKFPT